jgi:hypothetical protein
VIKPHLVPRDRAFDPADETFMSVFTRCRDVKPFYDFKADYAGVAASKKTAIDKVMYAASSPALGGGLSASEEKTARKYNEELVSRYKTHVGDDDLARVLDKRIAEVESEFDLEGASGTLRESLALKVNAGIYGVLRETDEERARRCLCDALIPRCPAIGEAPYFVPIACLNGNVDGAEVFITEVCAYCCRKQAMTWRTVQYFISDLRDDIAGDLETYCCHPKPPPKTKPDFRIPDIIFKEALKPDFDPRILTEGVTRGLSILGGAEPPTKYKVRPNIRELGIDDAKTALAGNGVDVVETIRAGDRTAVSKLREASSVDPDDLVLDDRTVSPGDKVALIVENGVAVDFIKVDSGGGKNLFDRPAAGAVVPEVDFEGKADAALAEFDERLAAKVAELETAGAGFDEALNRRREEVAAAAAELTRIGETRAGMAAEIESVRNDITRLRAERETIARDISTAAGELDRVRAVRDDLNREVTSVKAELASIVELQRTTLADAAREREKLVESIRRETPVTAVTGTEADFGTALVNRGVTNVGGLAGLSDTDLENVARESRLNLSTARRLRREAEARIGAPIR